MPLFPGNYRPLPWCASALLAALAAPSAHGVLRPDGSDDAVYRALGAQFAGRALFLDASFTYQETRYRVPLGAVRLNRRYALTAAHCINYSTFPQAEDHSGFSVGTGANFNTDMGQVAAVEQIIFFPGLQGYGDPTRPDLALLRLATPLPGEDAVIGPVGPVDAVLTHAGYGVSNTPSQAEAGGGGSLFSRDGYTRGWRARVSDSVDPAFNSQYYWADRTSADPSLNPAPQGRGQEGDSGSPLFNASGQLVGISVATTPGYADGGAGVTVFVMLNEPSVRAWIQANTALPACPADIGVQGGAPGADGLLNNNDFIVFIGLFFDHNLNADVGKQGGVDGPDGLLDNNDFVVFITSFFAGCPATP